MKKYLFLLFLGGLLACGVAGCAGGRGASGDVGLARNVASAYGVDHFHTVTALRYTFNVVIGEKTIRRSHENPDVQRLYKEFLGRPLSEKSHELLHTHYKAKLPRGIVSPSLKVV